MEQTLIFIKPDGIKKRLIGKCLARFEEAGMQIKALKMLRLKKIL